MQPVDDGWGDVPVTPAEPKIKPEDIPEGEEELDVYNKERTEEYNRTKINHSLQTKLKCPKCGKALYITDEIILASIPPKRELVCKACGHTSYMVA